MHAGRRLSRRTILDIWPVSDLIFRSFISHVVVFLTGTGTAVMPSKHIGLNMARQHPSLRDSQQPYTFNGMTGRSGDCWACASFLIPLHLPLAECLSRLSNGKPSAIFKLKGALPAQMLSSGQTASDIAVIGILCEPEQSVQAQLSNMPTTSGPVGVTSGALVSLNAQNVDVTLTIALKCAKHFFNYLSSFAQSVPSDSSLQSIFRDSSAQSALLSLCERWYKNLEVKTRNGVDWLNKEQD